jgi:hypothetical protein
MARGARDLDPRATLAALERNYVAYVVIGGLARVIRGTGEVTLDVDICPSPAKDNLPRLESALGELGARSADGRVLRLGEDALGEEKVELSTNAGPLTLVVSPAGASAGFADLRRAATAEHLGHGLRPLIASTGDLARMAAALHREQDVARLPELRRVMELEADRELTLTSETRGLSSAVQRLRRLERERGERELKR